MAGASTLAGRVRNVVLSADCCHLLTIEIACRMARTAVISIRTDPKLKEALEGAAYWDNRTLAGLVEKILKDWVVEKGYVKGGRPPKPPAK